LSQAGIIDVEAANPQIPTKFVTDLGDAVPLSNTLEVLGGEGITTSAAGNTLTISGIDATAAATALLATKGIASFDSDDFVVTDGFVTLSAAFSGVQTVLTDSGLPAVVPDVTGEINIFGGQGIDVTGQGPLTTVTVSGKDATTITIGMVQLASDAQAIAGTLTSNYAINPSSLKAKLGVQTDHGVAIGAGTTAALNYTAAGSTGELLIGATGADPAFGTSADGNFTFTNSTAATQRVLAVENTDTDGGSQSILSVKTPDGGSDPFLILNVGGTSFYSFGIDNSDSDRLKLTTGANPGEGTSILSADITTGAVKFANAYEFPVADGNASEILITDGADNLDWGTVGSLLTDLDNILFVGKHGSDANNGLTPNNAKLTIQAAVTAAAAGDTIIVYPGTYTETVTHAANNVAVIADGKPSNCIITQADANVIDFNTRSGILYKNFGISCTAATTAINTVQGSTGVGVFRDCQLSMVSAAAIAAIAQPAIGAITGAGELSVRFGTHTYTHTGNGGGTANKAAFRVGTGGSVHLDYIHTLTISNSGTALVTATGIDTNSTGVFEIHDCYIEVTDPDAVIVCGLVSLDGTGITNEFFRNEVHVTATNNAGYGFVSADTASSSRFFYNHIHVTDVAGTSYSFLVGNTTTVISQFDDIVAADGVSVTAGGTFTCVSSEMDGDITCRGREAGGIVQASVMNMDNTATAGNAAVNISVGGTTSTGDPYTKWLITGSTAFSAGIDNSDADAFKIGPNVDPSTGNSDFEIAAATGAITFNEAYTFPVADGNAGEILKTDGSGAITWQASNGGLEWEEVTDAAKAMAVSKAYGTNRGAGVAYTLPATSAAGDVIEIVGIDGTYVIAQNAGNTCYIGDTNSTAGVTGTLTSNDAGDCITLRCISDNANWRATSWSGDGFTIA